MRGLLLVVIAASLLTAAVVTRPAADGTPEQPPPSAASTEQAPPPITTRTGTATVTILDGDFNSGFYTDVTVDADGLPVVSYYDDSVSAVFLIRCQDDVCRDRHTATVDDLGDTGLFTSVALNGDQPVVSYYDLSQRSVRLATCMDPRCNDAVLTTLDTDAPELTATSVVVTDDGDVIVAYRGAADGRLRLAHCAEVPCEAPVIVDLDGPGVDEGIALDSAEARLHVAYRRDEQLRLVTCALPCSSPDPIVIDQGPGAGFYPSVVVGTEGTPVVAHLDFTAKQVEVFRCGGARCDRENVAVPEARPLTGYFVGLQVDGQERAATAFYDEAEEQLVLATCDTVSCDQPVRLAVDASPLVGQHLSFVLIDGNPVVVYHDGEGRQLRLARCTVATCRQPVETDRLGVGVDLAVTDAGSPVVAYRVGARGGARVLRCEDPDCATATVTAADDVARVSGPPSVAVGAGDLPVVAFQDLVGHQLRIGYCQTVRCPFLVGADVPGTVNAGDAPVVVRTDPLTVLQRNHGQQRIELLRCHSVSCQQFERTQVTSSAVVSGVLAGAPLPDGELIAAVDRVDRLRLWRCSHDTCEVAATLATDAVPAPVGLDVQALSEDVAVAVTYRSAVDGGSRVARCRLPCRQVAHLALPSRADFATPVWDGKRLRVVHSLGDTTMITACDVRTCDGPVEVAPTVGHTAAVTVGNRVVVAILPPTDSAPILSRCGPTACEVLEPEIVPFR